MSLLNYLPADTGKVSGSYVLVEVPEEILKGKEGLGEDAQTILSVVRNRWIREGNPLIVVDYSSEATLVEGAGKGGAVLVRENAFPQMMHEGDKTKMLFRDSDIVFTWPSHTVSRAKKAYEIEENNNNDLIDEAVEELEEKGHEFKEEKFREESESVNIAQEQEEED